MFGKSWLYRLPALALAAAALTPSSAPPRLPTSCASA